MNSNSGNSQMVRYRERRSSNDDDKNISRKRSSNTSISDGKIMSRLSQYRYSKQRYPYNSDVSMARPKESSSSSRTDFKIMKHFYKKSGDLLAERSLKEALKCIEVALGHCDKRSSIYLSKIYLRKGTILSLKAKPRCSYQSFLDWEHAYILDKDNIKARKKMSKVLFKGANKLYRRKKYDRAEIPCNLALELNEKNGEASVLKKLIERELSKKELSKTQNVGKKETQASTPPNMKTNVENVVESTSDDKYEILTAVSRLFNMVAECLEANNFPRAFILVQHTMQLYTINFENDMSDTIFCKLFQLKQTIMKVARELTGADSPSPLPLSPT